MNGVSRSLRVFLAVVFIAAVAGCQTTQPHVTAKVIFQQNDIAAEVSTEWR